MNQPATAPAERLDAAWKKFTARVDAVRAKANGLLKTVDEQKREREIVMLRKRINE
jgi:hypothetical protein